MSKSNGHVVQMFPGVPTTPKAFAGMLVEHSGEIAHIACVIEWKGLNGEANITSVCATPMSGYQSAWMKQVFIEDFPSALNRR